MLGGPGHPGRAHPQRGDPVGCAEPRVHDRRYPPFARRQGHLETQRPRRLTIQHKVCLNQEDASKDLGRAGFRCGLQHKEVA